MFRLAVPFYIVAIAVSFVGMGLGTFGMSVVESVSNTGFFISLISTIALILYFLLYMVTSLSSSLVVYLPHFHFYKHLFSDEGYLTMTLPVKMSDHLLSKTISAFVVSIIGIIVSAISLIAMIAPMFIVSEISFADIMDIFDFFGALNANGIALFVEIVFLMIVSAFSSVVMIFLAITLGAIVFKNHKIIGAIICYFLVSGILVAIEVALVFIVSFVVELLPDTISGYYAASHITLVLLILGFAAIGLGCYFTTLHLFKNKLNLE